MKMLDTRLVSLTSESILKLLPKFMSKRVQGKKLLFPLFIFPCLCLFVFPSKGGELVAKPQSVNKFFYPSYSVNTLLEQAKASSGKPSNINWLLNNSVVENGIYSLEFKSGKKGQYGGKPKGNGGVWENLSLKFSLDLLPKQYYHTSLPWLYENDLFNKDTRTHFRANRSRVVFSISGEWY